MLLSSLACFIRVYVSISSKILVKKKMPIFDIQSVNSLACSPYLCLVMKSVLVSSNVAYPVLALNTKVMLLYLCLAYVG